MGNWEGAVEDLVTRRQERRVRVACQSGLKGSWLSFWHCNLRLETSKFRWDLTWSARPKIDGGLEWTVDWFRVERGLREAQSSFAHLRPK